MTDPDPDATPNAWRTYLRAIETTPPGASHRVILQDDVELCGGFLSALELALAARPDSIVALFVPTALRHSSLRLLEACGRNEAWVVIGTVETWIPVVALAWPVRLIPDFAAWGRRTYPPEARRADDAIVGRYVRERGETVWATVPSLVEHPDDVESLLGLRTANPRSATCFAGEKAALIDWSKG